MRSDSLCFATKFKRVLLNTDEIDTLLRIDLVKHSGGTTVQEIPVPSLPGSVHES